MSDGLYIFDVMSGTDRLLAWTNQLEGRSLALRLISVNRVLILFDFAPVAFCLETPVLFFLNDFFNFFLLGISFGLYRTLSSFLL